MRRRAVPRPDILPQLAHFHHPPADPLRPTEAEMPPPETHQIPFASDRCATLARVPEDADGDTRPIHTDPDIGADEFSGEPAEAHFQDLPSDHWAYESIEFSTGLDTSLASAASLPEIVRIDA
jgi:hypothetical protein